MHTHRATWLLVSVLATLGCSPAFASAGGKAHWASWVDAGLEPGVVSRAVVARAELSFLDRTGHAVRVARVGTTVNFALAFTEPRSFPPAYTFPRFTVSTHGKAWKTQEYGTPLHITPGQRVRVAFPIRLTRGWLGTQIVQGVLSLLDKPNEGRELNREIRGVNTLTVTR